MTGASVSLWVAVLSLVGTGVLAVLQLVGKRAEVRVALTEVRVSNDANLRDDQREFIAVLQRERADLRERVDSLEAARTRDRRRIEACEVALRDAHIPIPDLP